MTALSQLKPNKDLADFVDGVKSIATLRLARLLVEKADNKGAIDLLNKDTNVAFTPS